MENKGQVVFKRSALRSIGQIATYIEEQGYPTTAERYVQRLLTFARSLSQFPNKYQLCKSEKLRAAGFRCASFEKTYVLVYKELSSKTVIFHVIHGKRLR